MSVPQNHHIIQLPTTQTVTSKASAGLNAAEISQGWLSSLGRSLANGGSQLSDVLHEDSWWRDMLTFDWEFHSIRGLCGIQNFVSKLQPRAQLSNIGLEKQGGASPALENPAEGLTWITSVFTFETRHGRGSGVFYLTQEEKGDMWKAYSVYTCLQELKGIDEPLGPRRPEGTIYSMPGGFSRGTWAERFRREVEFVEEDPIVLAIGAGQAGLNMGARLQSLNVSCLIVDKNERVGDNWRKRYRTLTLHDHAETSHLAYLPFPKTWPKYTPKDRLADWFEAYASIMDLKVWLKTEVKAADFDDVKRQWTVTLSRNGEDRTIHPRHVIWCAGHLSLPKASTFPGQSQFKGTIYHGSEHIDASNHSPKGKRVVVVGTGNSGHDIAEDFFEHGAEVTMVQRSGTYILTDKKGLPLLPESQGIEDTGMSQEIKDIQSESLPWPVTLAMCVDLTKKITKADQTTLDGLEKAGFKLEFGLDGAGILRLFIMRGGGYYIDFGCSQLIIDGKIKIKHCPTGIAGFGADALLLNDGSKLDADLVVLATGYQDMRQSVRTVLGDRIADRCKDVWGLDDEGEIKTMWRPSGHPNFWLTGGNLAMCRIYSKLVALQIAATEAGFITSDIDRHIGMNGSSTKKS